MELNVSLVIVGAVTLVSLLGLVFVLGVGSAAPVDERASSQSQSGRSSGSGTGGGPRGGRSASRVVLPDEDRKRRLEDRLVQAGLYRKNSVFAFVATQCMLALAPIGLAVLSVSFGWLTTLQALLAATITAISGVVVPGLWLDYKKALRQTAIRRALPDALDVIIVCVEAGLSLPAALVRVARELRDAHPMLAVEMTIVQREIQLGNTTGGALLHFANRFDLMELRSLSSVVRQAERFGASITSALRVHAESMRQKRLQAAQERAQKAAVKLLFPTVLCIFPAMFVVILGPAAFDIMEMMAKYGASSQP